MVTGERLALGGSLPPAPRPQWRAMPGAARACCCCRRGGATCAHAAVLTTSGHPLAGRPPLLVNTGELLKMWSNDRFQSEWAGCLLLARPPSLGCVVRACVRACWEVHTWPHPQTIVQPLRASAGTAHGAGVAAPLRRARCIVRRGGPQQHACFPFRACQAHGTTSPPHPSGARLVTRSRSSSTWTRRT